MKDPPAPVPQNYFVPHFGVDDDILNTRQSTAAAEKQHGHKWEITEEDKTPPPKRNYFVPHFGEDKDMTETHNSLALAEKQYGKWEFPDAPSAPPPTDYPVPHFGIDSDIGDSLKNLKDEEKIHGKWNLPVDDYFQVQLDSSVDREPLLTWAPTPKKSHPMDYFVPHFGEDHDITSSKANEAAAAKTLEHVWTPTKDKDGEWELPSSQIEFKLLQTQRR